MHSAENESGHETLRSAEQNINRVTKPCTWREMNWARGRASLGIMPGSGSDPGVILRPGSCIPAVFWLVGIQLVVSQRIPAEMCSAGLKYWVVAPLITTNLTTNRTGFRRFSASTSPQHLFKWVKDFRTFFLTFLMLFFFLVILYLNSTSLLRI